MKKTWIVITLLLIVFLLLWPADASQACSSALTLFIENVLPSLLPFMIAGGILSRLGFAAALSRVFARPFFSLFRLPGEAAFVFVCGLLCGNPVSAQAAGDLCTQQTLTPHQAQRAAALSSFASPAFLFGVVGVSMLGSAVQAVPIAFGHYLGSILNGVLWSLPERIQSPPQNTKKAPRALAAAEMAPMQALIDTAASTARTLPLVCVWICFFGVALRFMQRFGIWALICRTADALSIHADALLGLFSGFFEMTNGCAQLCTANLPSPALRAALFSAILSFGGLCVFFQNAAFLQPNNVPVKPIFPARLTHALFAFLCTLAFCRVFPMR